MAAHLQWEQTGPAAGRITTESGHEVAGYTWAPDQTHPFVHPLRHRDATGILTNVGPFDHTWHYGLWWSWKLINGMVFWENTEPDKQGGYAIDTHRAGVDADGRVVVDQNGRLRPHAEPETAWLLEQRHLVAWPQVPGADIDGGWALDWTLSWEAQRDCEFDVHPRVSEERWGGYMGLSYRAARSLAFDEFVLSSAGRHGGEYDMAQFDSCHARPARWVAYGGKLDGLTTGAVDTGGVAMFDHPSNLRHPAPWYVWAAGPQKDGFGFVAPAFLMDTPLTLTKGETLTLRYRVVPFAGQPAPAAFDAAWEAFAQT